jgi:hypothetical protein
MDITSFVPAAVAGYFALDATSHPVKSRLRRNLPHIHLKNVQLMPVIQIRHKNRVIWFHHWFNFSLILLASVFVTNAILDSAITRGLLVGGIVQGLKFSDRNIFHKHIES